MTCRTPNCARPVRIIFRQLCAACYEKQRRDGVLDGIGELDVALTGGRWVMVRGVARWQPDDPQGLDLTRVRIDRERLLERRLETLLSERFGEAS